MSDPAHPSPPTGSPVSEQRFTDPTTKPNSNTAYADLWNRLMEPPAAPAPQSAHHLNGTSPSLESYQSTPSRPQASSRVLKNQSGPPEHLTSIFSVSPSGPAVSEHPNNRSKWQTKYSADDRAFYCRQDTLLCAITCPESDISGLRVEDQIWVQDYRTRNSLINMPNHLEATASYLHKHRLATQLYHASCSGSESALAALPSALRNSVKDVREKRMTHYNSGQWTAEGAEWATKADCFGIVNGEGGNEERLVDR
jgi:hypothetical protein